MGKEKKEIGKLLELLNEYDPYIASDGEHKPNLWGYAYQGHSEVFPKELAESYIVSARYGFIEWLVENDKIDLDHLEYKYQDVMYELLESLIIENKSDFLIMLLSIQDEPIRFLCEILK